MSLVARHLEANGIPTVVMGSAIDIVEQCGVPRYLHSDLPLGNPCGVPYDTAMQKAVMAQGLSLFTTAIAPNTTLRSAAQWPGAPDWRDDYSKVDDSNREELRRKGEARRQQQAAERSRGSKRAPMIS